MDENLTGDENREVLESGKDFEDSCNPLELAARNPGNMRLAIAAKCWDCEGQNWDPCVEWRIANCVIPDCPLYPVRPHQELCREPAPKELQY